MIIRPEAKTEYTVVRAINNSAFETSAESRLVDALRERVSPVISLVAVLDKSVVGHIMFSPVTMAESSAIKLMGLAPMAVAPIHQRRGFGSALVERGIEACRELGTDAVVVLGHPDFYSRFGFKPASRFGISCEYDVPDDVFMAQEIVPNALEFVSGTARYHSLFGDL